MYYIDTNTEKIGSTHYCIYCGKQAIIETEWVGYECYEHYYCKCEIAKLEKEMNKEIRLINTKYAGKLKRNDKVLNKLKYENELLYLKTKYNQ